MNEAQDTLLSLAEVAVALAGFSAIVVALQRGATGKWSAVNADQFHGMVIHAIFAVSFCLLPMILNVVVQDATTTLRIACAILGVQIVLHCVGVMFFQTSNLQARVALMIGFIFGLTQFSVFTDWAVHREFQIYVLGVVWHILQAGFLFILLIWIQPSSIEGAGED